MVPPLAFAYHVAALGTGRSSGANDTLFRRWGFEVEVLAPLAEAVAPNGVAAAAAATEARGSGRLQLLAALLQELLDVAFIAAARAAEYSVRENKNKFY